MVSKWVAYVSVFILILGIIVVVVANMFIPDISEEFELNMDCKVCTEETKTKLEFTDDPNGRNAHSNRYSSDSFPSGLRAPCWCAQLRVARIAVLTDAKFCDSVGGGYDKCVIAAKKVLNDASSLVFELQFNIRLDTTVVTPDTKERGSEFLSWDCDAQNIKTPEGSTDTTSTQQVLTEAMCREMDVGLCVLFTGCPNKMHADGLVPKDSTTAGTTNLRSFCDSKGAVVVDEMAHKAIGKGGGNTFTTVVHEIGHAFGGNHAGVSGSSYGDTVCKTNNCGALGGGWLHHGQYYGFAGETLHEMCSHLNATGGQCLRSKHDTGEASVCEADEKSTLPQTFMYVGIAVIVLAVSVAVYS